MTIDRILPCLGLGLALLLFGCDADPRGGAARDPLQEEFTTLDWDALIPADWQPETLLEEFDLDAIDEIDDDDPRAEVMMERLLELWADAPVVEALDGQRVRLAGFVVPLDLEGGTMAEFLLVPYYGACIHVPPPPANQTIHVVAPPGGEYVGSLFDPVWISGTLRVVSSSSELAEAGYRIDLSHVAPYDGEIESL
jgi:hypothetical protein